MKLKAFLPKIEQRYVFVGSAVGAILPVSFYSMSVWTGTNASPLGWAFQNPSQCTLASLPAWAGLVALQLARAKRLRLKEAARQKVRERKLYHAATHDNLTGIGNRAALMRASKEQALTHAGSAVLLLDLDRFKLVNDTLGHAAGDELLKLFAERLVSIDDGNLSFFRLGGDEFVILSRLNDDDYLSSVAEKIEALLEEVFELSVGPASIGVSIGIAKLKSGPTAIEKAMQQADLALYSAKDKPGSAHAFYDEALSQASYAKLEMERDLAMALERGEFALEFQPILSAENGEVRSMEALLRWHHSERGTVNAERFMPVAERCGLSVRLGNWALRSACAEAVKWPGNTGVSVNVSQRHFEDGRFLSQVVQCLDETGLSPNRLTIEISEAMLTHDSDYMKGKLEQLRTLGVRVALDDFGLGISSLNRLLDIPVDRLKVERSLVAGILADARGAGLVDVMMQFGSAMKVATAIEGIEDERQMEFVRQRGASEVQGHLFSKPVRAEDVAAYLGRSSAGKGDVAA